MNKINIRFMHWYGRIGRYIYGVLFALSFIIALIQLAEKKPSIFIPILIDIALALVGFILETYLIIYSGRGTVYIETDKREDRFDLVQCRKNDRDYFVSEFKDEYVVRLTGETYVKSYKKSEVILEEDPNIERPVVEVVTSEKISKPADNEYSIFAMTGNKIKTRKQKIIVRDKAEDIIKSW